MLAAIAALTIVNALTIFLFWFDKRQAVTGNRRVRESHLLLLALIGGSLGALCARRIFRHKTRKEPFSTTLILICGVQSSALVGLALL